jgi:formylglycine-generating enzyme required for sulfatase activity
MKTSTFVVQAPPRRSASSTEATTSFLRGWAEPVTDSAIDAATGLPRLVRRTKDGATMALIPAGTFLMGAAPGDLGTRDDESPRHAVTLSRAYYLDVTEVTLAQFKTFAGAVGVVDVPEMTLDGTNDRTPAYNVTFEEARMFASWADVELPTEAQWERAARGGHDGYVYPWGMTDDVKRRNGGGEDDDGFKGIAPARSYEANDYGLFDMAGNVWEWCSDWYGAAYYASSPSADPTGPATGTERILRGSAWNSAAEGGPYDFRVSVRRSAAPTERVFSYGFRCAKRLP